ncbi:MAG: PQQ-binding-like beta-propeller repeat protein, partial [Thermoanaerobaculia bacterium]|nr:PQQ-binding-like beta-propeller repeat protein [Thermoanaerobaculia bacterium]
QGSGTNTMIRFCLAKRTPDNLSTNGITRDQNSLTEIIMETEDAALKNLNRWDPTQYINIWLVREICSAGSGCGVAGYAYFPSAHGTVVDGIVMEARWFGSSPGNTGVLAHEMGHYLGLYHTFQGGCTNNDCLIDGDRVCDTPPDNSTLWVPCDAQVNTCTTDTQSGFAADQNDMILNFMDYTDFDCFHDFTQGQSDRMNAAIQTIRASLLSSRGCNDPCPQPVIAAFTPASATISIGQSLTFTNISQNASSYNWSVAGVPFSSAVNAAYTFSAEGVFIVTLQANSATPDLCVPDTATAIIQVVCPVVADFQVSTLNPAAGETVTFTNNSQNATQFEWFVDGVSQGPALNSYTFNQTGVYIVRLEAGNGLCKKTQFRYIAVKDSCSDFSFQKTWGGSGDDRGVQTTLLSDGNFIIAGHTPGPGTGNDIVFLKTAPDGSLIWQKKYGGGGDEGITALTPMPDGGWVLAGYSSSMGANHDPLAARFSADGTVMWQKTMATASGADYFTDVKRTADGQLVLAGAVRAGGSQGSGAYLGKLDAGNGNTLWSRIYDGPRTDFIQNVCELSSGGFAACGFTMSFGQNSSAIHDGMALRTDASGNLIWTKAIGSVDNEGLYNIFETSDGGLMMIGPTSGWNGPGGGEYLDDGWLVKTTGDGNLLWSNIYRSDLILDYGPVGVVQEKDGSLVWAANDPAAFGANTPHFFKTDASGKLLWSRIYQGPDQGRILDVSALPDGYLFTGYYIAGGNRDICLLKTDAAGLAGQCDEIPHNMLVQSVQPLVVNGQLNTLQAPALQNANLTAGAAALNESVLCPPDCLDEPPPCKSFQNTYGTTADERGITGIEMPGGGYLVGGNITQNGDQDILVARLDASGEVLWSKRYGSTNQTEAIFDLQTRPDGGFFISFTLGTPADAAFAVCDPDGNVQFSRRIITSAGSFTDVFYDIIATSDGGYLAAGSFSPNDNSNWSAFFLKMDAAGATQWYRGWNNTGTDFVTGVRELPGSGYIASGYGNSFGLGGNHDGIAYRLDAAGNLLWTKAYGTASEGGFSDVAIAADGGFLFAAGLWNFNTPNTPEGGIVRTDANGNLLWTRIYRPSNNLDWETAGLVNTPDGNFVIAGRNRPNTGDTKAYLLKIDASGQLIWSKQYGGPGLESLSDVRALTSGDLLWTGRTTSAGSGSGDIYVLKTDADGYAGLCAETPHTTAAIPLQITQTNGSLQELTPPPLQNLSVNVQNIDVTKTEICAPDCDTPEICNNGLDDDGDSLFDCLDPDCDCHSCDGSETNIWYFGRQAGLNFSDNPPLILTDGKTNTNEASAVASDPLGRLIFYTDAKTVYQRNHTAMPNGSGLFGHGSSSQTLIVPHPGNSALFYVFTPDSYDNGPLRGLSYTVVDMSLNNGFGDVPAGQKNLPLTPASELVEQISAVRHCNGTDFWVLNHRKTSNAFLAYRIDQNGLNATPVVSNAGTGGPAPNGNYNVIGQMKISPDGLRLARALYHGNAVEVFDFDPATGIVGNPMLLQGPGLINPYGVEFSPAGRFLYATGLGNPASLFQFDLLAGDAAAVAASAVQLASFPGIYHYGQLQLAKNGKIYTTNSGPGVFTTQLGVIHHPDEPGAACLYQENGQALTGTPGTNLSLPNFLVSYFWKLAVWFEEADLEDTVCQLPTVQTYSLKKLPCGVQSVDFQV